MRTVLMAIFALGVSGALGACAPAEAFSCLADSDCGDGTCQPTGYCSFDDAACPSGQRYGSASASSLADRCVPEDAAVETSSSTSAAETTSISATGGEAEESDTTDESSTSTDDSSTGTDEIERCGDGILADAEECEPALLSETCESLGYRGGVLLCSSECTYDISNCEYCGNGVVEPGELCDGPLPDIGCSELEFGAVAGGSVSCNDTCDDIVVDGCGPFVCDADPAVVVDEACPDACSSCGPQGGCIFECTTEADCASDTIECPPGRPCQVLCDGTDACTGLTVRADDIYRVDVVCSGAGACAAVHLDCADAFGQCFLDCDGPAANDCTNPTIDCGFDQCGLKCATPSEIPEANIACGSACGCEYCGTQL